MKKKTHEEYKRELLIKNPNLKLLNEYTGGHKKVKYICLICGNENEADATSLLRGHGCPICGIEKMKKSQRLSSEEFLDRMKNIQPNLDILGEYINSHSEIKVKCKVCGTEYSVRASNLLCGYKCMNCYLLKHTKKHEDFIKEVKLINPNIDVISKYKSKRERIKVKCKVCGHIWEPLAYSLLYKNGCPVCRLSKGENKIKKILDVINIKYFPQYRFDNLKGLRGGKLSYDFFLPDFNMLIEYQGEFHDGNGNYYMKKNLPIQQEHDNRKRKYAEEHKIKLLEIWYWDFDNIEIILRNHLLNPVFNLEGGEI